MCVGIMAALKYVSGVVAKGEKSNEGDATFWLHESAAWSVLIFCSTTSRKQSRRKTVERRKGAMDGLQLLVARFPLSVLSISLLQIANKNIKATAEQKVTAAAVEAAPAAATKDVEAAKIDHL